MKARSTLFPLVWATLLLVGAAPPAAARSLAEQVNSFFGPGGRALTVKSAAPNLVRNGSPFSSATLATLGLVIKQFVPRAADFPVVVSK